MNEVVAFLPCRAGSERVPHKNTKPFSASGLSLIQIKLSQLVNSDLIGKIIVSSNDNTVLDISSNFHPKVTVNKRPDSLCCSNTSTDDLIKYVPTIIQDATVLWTHVTSPFISSAIYDSAIDKFLNNSSFDSLMSVTPCHDFLWDSQGPINYDRSLEKWPRTQTLNKLFRVNSGIFISSSSSYNNALDRIGVKPFLYELDSLIGFDIDWPNDFILAQSLLSTNLVSI